MKNRLKTEPAKHESKPVTPEKRETEPIKSATLEPQESVPAKSELEPAKQPKQETKPPESVKQIKRETEPTPVSDSAKPAQPPPMPKVSLKLPFPGYQLTSVTLLLSLPALNSFKTNALHLHIFLQKLS